MFLTEFNNNKLSTDEKNLIRASAYQAIEKYKVKSLPYYSHEMVRHLITVDSYFIKNFRYISDDKIGYERCVNNSGGYGTIIYDTDQNRYLFFYNDSIPGDYLTWTFAAFIACVELDLVPPDTPFNIPEDNPYIEEFVQHFAAPDPILKECGITSSLAIAEACDIPFRCAKKKSKNLRRRFAITALDEHIKFLFRKFIDTWQHIHI